MNAQTRYKKILIMGNVATGKSTLMDFLASRLPALPVAADELYKTNPFFAQAVEDRVRWSFASDTWFLYERVQIARRYEQLLYDSHLVIDSGLPMSLVYAHSRLESGTMTPEEWDFYERLYAELTRDIPLADVVIYLDGPVEVLRRRIESRGREFEIKHHSLEYLQSLSHSLEVVADKLATAGIPVEKVDIHETEHARSEEFFNRLVKRFN